MAKQFEDAPTTACITTVKVLAGAPILLVTHDEDGGDWQFLCGTTNAPADGRIVCLADMVARDPTLLDVADLPLGWRADRERVGGEWTREPYSCSED
jgi:hypothetical protein